jgi:hypothetical protein
VQEKARFFSGLFCSVFRIAVLAVILCQGLALLSGLFSFVCGLFFGLGA